MTRLHGLPPIPLTAPDDEPPWEPQDEQEPEQEIETPGELFEAALITFDDMELRPPPEFLVDKVLVRNSLVVIFGPPGVGKSFLKTDIGAHVALGAWWQGREVKGGDVLAIDAEGAGGLPQRMAAWKKLNRVHQVPGHVTYPGAVNLLDPMQVDVVVDVCRRRRFALITIDTVARSMAGGDENSAKDMGLVILAADRIRKASGGTVALIHHTGKDATAGMRGSSALEGAADTVLEVRGGEGTIELVCRKQKDAARFPSIQLSLAVVEVTLGEVETTSCAVTGRDRTRWVPDDRVEEAKAVLVQLLSSTGLPSSHVRDAVMAKLSVQKTTAYELINALVGEGALRNTGSDHRPFYVLGDVG